MNPNGEEMKMRVETSWKLLHRLARVFTLAVFIVITSQVNAQDTGAAESIAWNNNGTKVAAGYDSGLVEIMDATGQELRSFQLPGVIAVTWNPQDSDILAVSASGADGPGNVFILNTATGQQTLLDSQGDWIPSISWKPDGSRLAGSIGYTADPLIYRSILIWDTTTGQISSSILLNQTDLLSLAWSPDSSFIAGGSENNVTIWDASTGTVVKTLVGHTSTIQSVAWSPDGSKLASSSGVDDSTIRIWDVATGQNTLIIPAAAFVIAWSPDGMRIANEGLSNIFVWNVSNGQLLNSVSVESYVDDLAWSPDGSKLAFGSDNGVVQIVPDPSSIMPTVCHQTTWDTKTK
jgi:WD40 repeat protein